MSTQHIKRAFIKTGLYTSTVLILERSSLLRNSTFGGYIIWTKFNIGIWICLVWFQISLATFFRLHNIQEDPLFFQVPNNRDFLEARSFSALA